MHEGAWPDLRQRGQFLNLRLWRAKPLGVRVLSQGTPWALASSLNMLKKNNFKFLRITPLIFFPRPYPGGLEDKVFGCSLAWHLWFPRAEIVSVPSISHSTKHVVGCRWICTSNASIFTFHPHSSVCCFPPRPQWEKIFCLL